MNKIDEPPLKFSKREGLTGYQFLDGVGGGDGCLGREGHFFQDVAVLNKK